jgi:hypothetical protein
MKIRRLDKLPKRKVTVDELLDRADIQEIKEELQTLDTDELLVIYSQGEKISWRSNMTISRLVYLIEVIKKALLEDD